MKSSAAAMTSIILLVPLGALAEEAGALSTLDPPTIDLEPHLIDVEVTSVDVEGPLDAKVARAVVERQLAPLDRCFKRLREKAPDLRGDAELRVLVGTRGEVVSAAIESSDLDDDPSADELERCAMERAMAMRFAASRAKAHSTLRYSLRFEPPSVLGSMMGNEIGESFGFGGLGLSGTGSGNARAPATPPSPSGGPAPLVRTGNTTVRGQGLTKEVISRQIRRELGEFRACYEQQLAQVPNLAGGVSVRFTIATSGQVSTASIESSTVGNPDMEQCLLRVTQQLTFPPPSEGGVVIVTYPFTFQQDAAAPP